MEWLLLPAAAALAWYLGSRKPSAPPPLPPPPPKQPPPRRFKAELLHQAVSLGITETDGIYEVKPLNTTVPVQTTLMAGPLLAFGGEGYVNSDGSFEFWGRVRKTFTYYDVSYKGTIRPGETVELDRHFKGSELFGIQMTVGEVLRLRAT